MGGEIRGGNGGLGGERIEEFKGETVLPTTRNGSGDTEARDDYKF